MEHREFAGSRLMRDAAITLAVVVLAVMALDDITTDSARSFPLERTMLAASTVWFFVVAWRLWRQGHRVLGALSFGLAATAALAQPTIGPLTAPLQPGYLATLLALAWFLLLAGVLAALAWRLKRRHAI